MDESREIVMEEKKKRGGGGRTGDVKREDGGKVGGEECDGTKF